MKTSMKKKVMIGQMLKEVAAYNESNVAEQITIEIDGVKISNPFVSECGKYNVEPVGYYGYANMQKLYSKFYAFKNGGK